MIFGGYCFVKFGYHFHCHFEVRKDFSLGARMCLFKGVSFNLHLAVLNLQFMVLPTEEDQDEV